MWPNDIGSALIMWSLKTGRKTTSVASALCHVAPFCWNQMLPISFPSIIVNKDLFKMARLRSPFSKKNGPITPLDQNLHQTLTRFGCIGFSMYTCGFSVLQIQFCLFTYQARSKWTSFEKMIFFLPKSASSISRSISNPGFTSNKPTHYLLDHGDFMHYSKQNNIQKDIVIWLIRYAL